MHVLDCNILQPAARQMERVQSEEYELYVCGRNLLQPAAPRSLVPLIRFSNLLVKDKYTLDTFFSCVR